MECLAVAPETTDLVFSATRGEQAAYLLAPREGCGSFTKMVRNKEAFVRFMRQVLHFIEKVEGHRSYHLRLCAGCEPPAMRSGPLPTLTDELQAHMRQAGPLLSQTGRPILVVVPNRSVQFQSDCTDDELAELWSLALDVINRDGQHGLQDIDQFDTMRLNAGSFQNIRDRFQAMWADHPGYQAGVLSGKLCECETLPDLARSQEPSDPIRAKRAFAVARVDRVHWEDLSAFCADSQGTDSGGKGSASEGGGKGAPAYRVLGRGQSPHSESSTPSLMPPNPAMAAQAWSTDESSPDEAGEDRFLFGEETRSTSGGYMKRRRSRATGSERPSAASGSASRRESQAERNNQSSPHRRSLLESLTEGVANLWANRPEAPQATPPSSRDSFQSTVLISKDEADLEETRQSGDGAAKEGPSLVDGEPRSSQARRGTLFDSADFAQSWKRLSSDFSAGVASITEALRSVPTPEDSMAVD
ncbi:unnamed protein product [Symbiodinium natans]|uniref:Uncharacterized protein n=1 Tax=Symbiodinium natans TaxID=878477 RepID=A0A812L130_9DINO|nr:unnamed protein product [Symbiodinium natans]